MKLAKGFLGCIHHVEEAVLILLLLIDVQDGGGDANHAPLVHQQEEGLSWVQLQSTSDDFHQLAHIYMIRDQEFGFVQNRKLFFPFISLDDDLEQRGAGCVTISVAGRVLGDIILVEHFPFRKQTKFPGSGYENILCAAQRGSPRRF